MSRNVDIQRRTTGQALQERRYLEPGQRAKNGNGESGGRVREISSPPEEGICSPGIDGLPEIGRWIGPGPLRREIGPPHTKQSRTKAKRHFHYPAPAPRLNVHPEALLPPPHQESFANCPGSMPLYPPRLFHHLATGPVNLPCRLQMGKSLDDSVSTNKHLQGLQDGNGCSSPGCTGQPSMFRILNGLALVFPLCMLRPPFRLSLNPIPLKEKTRLPCGLSSFPVFRGPEY